MIVWKAILFFSNLWSSITSEELKTCNYFTKDDLKQQLDDSIWPLFQPLSIYYVEKLSELFKKHSISHTKDLYNVAIENVTKLKFGMPLRRWYLIYSLNMIVEKQLKIVSLVREKDVRLRALIRDESDLYFNEVLSADE